MTSAEFQAKYVEAKDSLIAQSRLLHEQGARIAELERERDEAHGYAVRLLSAFPNTAPFESIALVLTQIDHIIAGQRARIAELEESIRCHAAVVEAANATMGCIMELEFKCAELERDRESLKRNVVEKAGRVDALDAALRPLIDPASWFYGERCPDCGESITGNCAEHSFDAARALVGDE